MSAKMPSIKKALAAHPTPPEPQPLAEWPHVRVQWHWVEPAEYSGDSPHDPRLYYRRVVVADGLTNDLRHDMRRLRSLSLYDGPLLGDELKPTPGSTRRGVPPDYDGTDPKLCNAKTRTGRPCRALALPSGRCKWHGGRSTGPRTGEGKRRSAANLIAANAAVARKRRSGEGR